jgi:hypothetical protein
MTGRPSPPSRGTSSALRHAIARLLLAGAIAGAGMPSAALASIAHSHSDVVADSQAIAPAAAPQVQADSPESHLAEARRLFQALDYERAVAELDQVVAALNARRSEPTTRQPLTEALELRARTQVGLGHLDRAQDDFRALLEISPDYRLAEDVSPRVVAVFTQVRAQTIGQLTVNVEPADAQVRLDGRPIRTGDEPVDVISGPHVLTAIRSGYRPASMDLIADAGRTAPVRLVLERASATLFVMTKPSGADILINGASRGRTEAPSTGRAGADARVSQDEASVPLAIGDLEPGAYTIDVRKPCHVAARETLTIERLDDYRVGPIALKPAVATLQVGSSVGADIWLDGHQLGDAPRTIDDLCEGSHVVEARTSTGRDVRTIEIHTGEKLTVTLSPRPVVALIDAFAVADPSRTAELRTQVASTLAAAAGVFVYAPPLADVRRAAQTERAPTGWLALDLNRQPLSTGARQMLPDTRRDLSARLSKALDAQGIAAVTIPAVNAGAAGSGAVASGRIVWLSILAANSGEPDVIEINLDQPEAAMRALDAAPSQAMLLRRSLGVSLVDVMYRPGPVVSEVGAGASSAGLAIGDAITHVNDASVATAQDIRRVLDSMGQRDTVTLRVQSRTGASRVVEAPIRLEPRIAMLAATSEAANIALIDLRARLRSAGGLEEAALHLNLAALLMRLASWNAAAAELQDVKLPDTAGVSNGTVQYLLGRCFDALGRAPDAQQAFDAAGKVTGSTLGEDGPLIAELVAVRRK